MDMVPLNKRYADLMHKWENSEAAFWGDMGDRQFFSRAMLQNRWQQRMERLQQPNSPFVRFGMQTKDGQPIGFMVIAFIDFYHRHAMLGAMIGEPDYWGGGYGTDALLLITDYAFGWLDLRKLWLMTMSLNARVVRQMEKVGYTLEARQREAAWVDGEWHDGLIYGLLREEWPGRETVINRIGLRARKGMDG